MNIIFSCLYYAHNFFNFEANLVTLLRVLNEDVQVSLRTNEQIRF